MADTTPKPATKRYVAINPLEVDGKAVAEGKTVNLTDELAGPLVAVGAVKLSGKAAAADDDKGEDA